LSLSIACFSALETAEDVADAAKSKASASTARALDGPDPRPVGPADLTDEEAREKAIFYLTKRQQIDDERFSTEQEWIRMFSIVGDLGQAMELGTKKDELEQKIEEMAEKEAKMTAVRGINGLGDDWDMWYGRLRKWREIKDADGLHHLQPTEKESVHGHEIGPWVRHQRHRFAQGWLEERRVAKLRRLNIFLAPNDEYFAMGLRELRRWVKQKQTNNVSLLDVTDSGFQIGEWVTTQRFRQRRGRLSRMEFKLLQEAFFCFRPKEPTASIFSPPDDPQVANVTRTIEGALVGKRIQSKKERQAFFKQLVLKYHPDIWEDDRAGEVIQFLANVKTWFLAAN